MICAERHPSIPLRPEKTRIFTMVDTCGGKGRAITLVLKYIQAHVSYHIVSYRIPSAVGLHNARGHADPYPVCNSTSWYCISRTANHVTKSRTSSATGDDNVRCRSNSHRGPVGAGIHTLSSSPTRVRGGRG